MLRRAAQAAALAAALLAQPAAAQVADGTASYRADLSRCMEVGDMVCALEVLLAFGEEKAFEPVAVSVDGGPTIYGTQLYAVLARAEEQVPAETWKAMTEAVVSYVLDAQPQDAFAPAPFILLNGEACAATGDRRCVLNAASHVQLMLSTGQWYFPGIGDMQGDNDARVRAEAFVKETLGGGS